MNSEREATTCPTCGGGVRIHSTGEGTNSYEPVRQQPAVGVGELERAYQMLEIEGVPRERARSVANGIDVLATRMRRERQDFHAAITALQQQLADREKEVGVLQQQIASTDSNRVLNLRAALTEARNELEAREQQIDALMMEFCPRDITTEQWKRIEQHTKPVSDTTEAAIQQALAGDRDGG